MSDNSNATTNQQLAVSNSQALQLYKNLLKVYKSRAQNKDNENKIRTILERFNNLNIDWISQHFQKEFYCLKSIHCFYAPRLAIATSPTSKDTTQIRTSYFLENVEAVIIWDKPVNTILLHHIRQIILVAWQISYEKQFKKLPWSELIFYLQQYIKFSTANNFMHLFQVSFVSIEQIVKILRLFKKVLEKEPQDSLDQIISTHKKTIETLKNNYEMLRGIYVINRIITYLKQGKDINLYGKVRILLILGECLKSTPRSRNISNDLNIIINKYIFEHIVSQLKDFRNEAAHLVNINLYLRNSFSDFHDFSKLLQRFVRIHYDYLKKIRIEKYFSTLELPSTYYLQQLPLLNVSKNIYIKELLNTQSNSTHKNQNTQLSEYESIIAKMIQDMSNDNKRINESLDNFVYDDYLKILRKSYQYDSILDLEMNLMITLNYLHKIKRINVNRKWYMEKYPTLTALELRNHLAHGDPIVETLDLDEDIIVRDTARLLTEELDNPERKKLDLSRITDLSIDDLRTNSEITLEKLIRKEEFFENIKTSNLEEVKEDILNTKEEWRQWTTHKEQNILHLTCLQEDIHLFYLIKKNACSLIDIQDGNGNTIFHLATINCNIDIVNHILTADDCQCLLDEHLIRNKQNETPLHLAAILGHEQLIQRFLNSPILKYVQNTSNCGWSAIMYAACSNHVSIVKLLTQFSYDSIQNCLFIASYFGAIDVVKYLVELGTNLNYNKYEDKMEVTHYIDLLNVLEVAIERKHTEISNFPMGNGAYRIPKQYDKSNSRELFTAIKEGSYDDVENLLKTKPKLIGEHNRVDGRNSMHYAVLSENTDIIQVIYCRFPHLLYISDRNGNTPIQLSAKMENSDIIQYILQLIIDDYQKRPFAVWSLQNQFTDRNLKIVHYDVIFKKALTMLDSYKENNFLQECAIYLMNNTISMVKNCNTQLPTNIDIFIDQIYTILLKFTNNVVNFQLITACMNIIIEAINASQNPLQSMHSILEKININCTFVMVFLKIVLELQNTKLCKENTWAVTYAMQSANNFKDVTEIQLLALKIIEKYNFNGGNVKTIQFIATIFKKHKCSSELMSIMPEYLHALLKAHASSVGEIVNLLIPFIGDKDCSTDIKNQCRYMTLVLECFMNHEYKPKNAVLNNILKRVMNSMDNFWICDNIMCIGPNLVFHLMDRIQLDDNDISLDDIEEEFHSVMTIPRKYNIFKYFDFGKVSTESELKFLCHLIIKYSKDQIIQRVVKERIRENINFLLERNENFLLTILEKLNENQDINYEIIGKLFLDRDYKEPFQNIINSKMEIVLKKSLDDWVKFEDLWNKPKFTNNQANILLHFALSILDLHENDSTIYGYQQHDAMSLLWRCWKNIECRNKELIQTVAVLSYHIRLITEDPPKACKEIIKDIIKNKVPDLEEFYAILCETAAIKNLLKLKYCVN